MKKLSKKRASAELDKILESVAKPKVKRAQQISQLKNRLNEQLKGAESTPGINITNKVLKDGGKQNQDALKAVADKLKNYLKYKFNSNPEFPHQNNSKTDYDSPMYRNNTDQEDYIDDWRGGGMADLEYDTEPSKEFGDNFKKYLDGSSDKGNAQSNKDGDLGNVVSNKVGERIQKTLKRKHKKLQGDQGFAIPNDWTQHPNAGYIPKLSEAYEDDIDAEIEMEEEADYMGAPSQVEKRDTYDGRPGKVVGVYSNIKKQRDMDEGHIEGHDDESDLEEFEFPSVNLPGSGAINIDFSPRSGDKNITTGTKHFGELGPDLGPDLTKYSTVLGDTDPKVNIGYDAEDEAVDELDAEVMDDYEGDDYEGDDYEGYDFVDDENFDDVGNKSFDDIEGEGSYEKEDTLALNENVKRDMKSMKHLIGYSKKTQ